MEYEGLPVSEPLSTGVHESQSLLWERMVAGGLPFCHYLLPLIKEYFPEFPATATAGDLYRAMNVVHDPSLVRTESDEVTYPMHVVLRYELERDLINGSIQVGAHIFVPSDRNTLTCLYRPKILFISQVC